jgi:hypothetical protein
MYPARLKNPASRVVSLLEGCAWSSNHSPQGLHRNSDPSCNLARRIVGIPGVFAKGFNDFCRSHT